MILPSEANAATELGPSWDLWNGDVDGEVHRSESHVEPLEFVTVDATRDGEERPSEPTMLSEAERQALERDERTMELDVAHHKGYAQGREEAAEDFERRLALERQSIAATCEAFDKERSEYFARLEIEATKLALAIASRILHREARLDPLLLQGAVKDVLKRSYVPGQSGDGHRITLRVPSGEVEGWREILRDSVAVAVDRDIVADAGLTASQCVLETGAGHVVLGLQAQLDEVEAGFAELWGREA